jgi:hypothetical protein
MNFTGDFSLFYSEIIDECQTLPLILMNLEYIVDNLLKYLKKNTIKKEILSLFICLFRDVQGEIYKIFCEKIFPNLAD